MTKGGTWRGLEVYNGVVYLASTSSFAIRDERVQIREGPLPASTHKRANCLLGFIHNISYYQKRRRWRGESKFPTCYYILLSLYWHNEARHLMQLPAPLYRKQVTHIRGLDQRFAFKYLMGVTRVYKAPFSTSSYSGENGSIKVNNRWTTLLTNPIKTLMNSPPYSWIRGFVWPAGYLVSRLRNSQHNRGEDILYTRKVP